MKRLALIAVIITAMVGLSEANAASMSASNAGAFIGVHWNDHSVRHDRCPHRGGFRHSGYRHANPALLYRQASHRRAVNGYAGVAKRRPCEWVRVERTDAYGQPLAIEYKRCYTAAGYGFEVPGSRAILR